MLTLAEKQTRFPYILTYLSESPQREKLLTFLKENKTILMSSPFLLALSTSQLIVQVESSTLPISESKTPYHNGQLTFSVRRMQSLGKENYAVTFPSFAKFLPDSSHFEKFLPDSSAETQKPQESQKPQPASSFKYVQLPNGLFMQPTKDCQYVIEVSPSPLFYSFHANCILSHCVIASFLSPYPSHLCQVLKDKKDKKDNHLITLTAEEARIALQGEQYGFFFSEKGIQVPELFEEVKDVLSLCIITDFSRITLSMLEACVFASKVVVLITFALSQFPLLSVEAIQFLKTKKIPLVIVQLQAETFEMWWHKQQVHEPFSLLVL